MRVLNVQKNVCRDEYLVQPRIIWNVSACLVKICASLSHGSPATSRKVLLRPVQVTEEQVNEDIASLRDSLLPLLVGLIRTVSQPLTLPASRLLLSEEHLEMTNPLTLGSLSAYENTIDLKEVSWVAINRVLMRDLRILRDSVQRPLELF